MTWSAAEVSALAVRAARGAGAPPAQAEWFGRAATVHLLSGRDVDSLCSALEALPAGPILTYPGALEGAVAAASRGSDALLPDMSLEPLLSSYVESLSFSARIQMLENKGLCLHVDLTMPRARHEPGRISGCAELMAQMERLAQHTYVPESETSRQSGAGAGLSDND